MKPDEIQKIMQQAQQMQTRMSELQNEMAAQRFEASSGGGMITAVVTGGLRVVEIRIEPEFFAEGDREMIQDLTAAAINTAFTRAQEYVQEQMQKVSFAGLNLPGMPGGLGGA